MTDTLHAFTLKSQLNPSETSEMNSGPLSGKKTGGMVTAEEYNRILEMLSEGGGGSTGSNVVYFSAVHQGTGLTISTPNTYT